MNDVRFFSDEHVVQHVLGEERAEAIMHRFVMTHWTFPVTLYVEVLDESEVAHSTLPLQRIESFHDVWTLDGRQKLPTFCVTITNEAMLEVALDDLFFTAEQNNLFALANMPCIAKRHDSLIMTEQDGEVLLAYYDGSGVLKMTIS